ncbi:hypothetical protein A2U01_0041965, partial [Trifolium medium]|nr:hypothetical protein [Trifolium medium]
MPKMILAPHPPLSPLLLALFPLGGGKCCSPWRDWETASPKSVEVEYVEKKLIRLEPLLVRLRLFSCYGAP